MTIPTEENHIHFIGIGGAGMAPMAQLLHYNGYLVSGSDQKKTPKTKKLEDLGIKISYTHSCKHIQNTQMVVYSSAIKENNPELVKAQKDKKNLLHRSDLLHLLMQGKISICVSGTHGKSTTSALITHLINAHGTPSISIIGGETKGCNLKNKIETAHYLVAEADESDGTFIKYNPKIAVITNIKSDHLDFYKSYANIISAFSKHLTNLEKNSGTLVYNADDETCVKLSQKVTQKISYGFKPSADIQCMSYNFKENQTFIQVATKEHKLFMNIPIIGKHNIYNTLAAFGVGVALKMNLEKVSSSLKNFSGVKRRLNLIYNKKQIKIFDDYAHNPDKIRCSLEALSNAYPKHEIKVVFEAHRYSRLKTMYKAFLQSFKKAKFVYVLPVFSCGEPHDPQFSPRQIASDLCKYGKVKAREIDDGEESLRTIKEDLKPKDILVSFGAGDANNISFKLKNDYAKKQQKKE